MGQEKPIHKVARQGGITYGVTVFLFLVRFVKSAVISRILGPERRGIFGILNLIPELLSSLGSLSFGPATIYYVGRERYDGRKAMGGNLLFLAVLGVILAALGFVLFQIDVLFKEDVAVIRKYMLLTLIVIPVMLAKFLGSDFLLARDRVGALNVVRTVFSVLPLALFLLFWAFLENPLSAAVLSWCLSSVVVGFLPFWQLRSSEVYPPAWPGPFLRRGLAFGLAGHFANFFQMIMLRSDFLFISAMLGTKKLGYYAITTNVAELLLMLPESLAIPFIPTLLQMEKKDSDSLVPPIFRFLFTSMALCGVITILFGKFFIRLIFGEDFLPAYEPLVYLQPGIVAVGLYMILKIDLFNHKQPGIVSILTGVGAGLNLALNYHFIHWFGIKGAAITSSISYIVVTILLYVVYYKRSGNGPYKMLVLTRSDIRMIVHAARKRFDS
ncbi:MAG: polysaccharide biosynthesis C-terminal domain-containing protein [Planctomycetota bacterium]